MFNRLNKLFVLLFCLFVAISCNSFASSDVDQVLSDVRSQLGYLIKIYKDLHHTPELSLREKNTARKLANELRKLGFEVTENFAGTNVIGILKNGGGPTIMIRTVMDGLPLRERTGLDYASDVIMKDQFGQDMPVMHAVAHDMHMTVWIGTAHTLVKLKNNWHGTIIMVAQSAEEIGEGARMMIDNQLFKVFPKPDYALSFHLIPEIPSGKIGYKSGFMMANVDTVDMEINGIGGHGAEPEKTIDPIVLSAKIILDFQTIISRNLSTNDPAIITIGSINGGNRHNIIPDQVKLQLTVRSYKDSVRNQIFADMKRISDGDATAAGLDKDKFPRIAFKKNYTPSLYNNPTLLDKLIPSYQRAVGKQNVVEVEPFMVGEDFSRYGRTKENIPINMFVLGIGDPKKLSDGLYPDLNSPFLSVYAPELVIITGVKTMAISVMDLTKNIVSVNSAPAN